MSLTLILPRTKKFIKKNLFLFYFIACSQIWKEYYCAEIRTFRFHAISNLIDIIIKRNLYGICLVIIIIIC